MEIDIVEHRLTQRIAKRRCEDCACECQPESMALLVPDSVKQNKYINCDIDELRLVCIPCLEIINQMREREW